MPTFFSRIVRLLSPKPHHVVKDEVVEKHRELLQDVQSIKLSIDPLRQMIIDMDQVEREHDGH